MVEVTVQVPPDRVAEFYRMVGDWLQATQSEPPPKPKQDREKWTADDFEAALQLWRVLPLNSRRLLDVLVDEGDLDGASIVQRLGLHDVSKLVGVHGWAGRIASDLGKTSPIKTKPTEEGTVWSLDPALRELFSRARDAWHESDGEEG